MQSKAKTIEAYIAEVPAYQRAVLQKLDSLVRRALPFAVAGMQYGMPTYSLGDHMVAFNAQKQYFSFYADPAFVARFKSELTGFSTGKSCIRFRTLEPKLITVLERILQCYDAALQKRPLERAVSATLTS